MVNLKARLEWALQTSGIHLIQYKDVLPVQEIPLWGWDGCMILLSPQWDFQRRQDGTFILNPPPAYFYIKTVFPGKELPIIKIRQSWDCFTFIKGISIHVLVTRHIYTETTTKKVKKKMVNILNFLYILKQTSKLIHQLYLITLIF